MSKGLFVDKPQSVVFREIDDPDLLENQVRVQTEFASIKHGTEFTVFSGKSPFHGRRFDGQSRLFVAKEPGLPEFDSGIFIGNTVVGTVIETGSAVTGIKSGDRVYGYHQALDKAILPQENVHPLTAPMTAQDAVCIDPAAVAFAALRDARVCLGDNVIVFGLGAIGLFLVQLLQLAGCAQILAVDPIANRRELACSFGATHVLDPGQVDVAVETRSLLGAGADIAIEASGSYKALHLSMRSVRMCARVVTLGYYHGRDTELELGAEWFHNRLELICSMPHWGNPLRDYPLWDEKRVVTTVKQMFLKKQLTSDGILDPIVDFSDFARAFIDIYHNPAQAIKLGIRFP